MIRDLVGYGGAWPDFRWPNGSRLAVSVVINFEEGAERQVLEGDAENEQIGEEILVELDRRRDRLWQARRIELARAFAEAVS